MNVQGSDGGGSTFSAAEEAFISSGGESPIPDDGAAGADAGVSTGGSEGGEGSPADGSAKADSPAPKNDHVPLATFLEEKKARKELATRLADQDKQLAEFRGKFAIIDKLKLGGGEPDPQTPAGPPKIEDDIFGAVRHIGETVAQMEKRQADEKAAKEANEKAAAEQKTFVDNYTKACDEFEKTTPDPANSAQ